MSKRVTAKEKREVTERARYLCEYCRSPSRFSTQSFSVEHIHPRQKGGDNALDNLAFACQGCNGSKHTKTTGVDPFTDQRVPLYHPRQHTWSDHFSWSDDYTLVLGLTPTGRATIHVLQLNREGLMNLRWALRAINRHPPEEQRNAKIITDGRVIK